MCLNVFPVAFCLLMQPQYIVAFFYKCSTFPEHSNKRLSGVTYKKRGRDIGGSAELFDVPYPVLRFTKQSHRPQLGGQGDHSLVLTGDTRPLGQINYRLHCAICWHLDTVDMSAMRPEKLL